MVIQECDLAVKYSKATEHKVADTLSRSAPVVGEKHIHEVTDVKIIEMKYEIPLELKHKLRNLAIEQDRDPSLHSLKDSVRQRDHPRYRVEENVLYKLMGDC